MRSGLLAVASAIFIQHQFMEQSYDYVLHLYINVLSRLSKATNIDLPIPIVLWPNVLSLVIIYTAPS